MKRPSSLTNMTALLATLPLQVVCQLLVTGHPEIIENGTIVGNKPPRRALSLTQRDQGYIKFPDVDAAYKIHEELATWNEARERCISEGGNLAITDSPEKIAHITGMKNQSEHWLHVGIYKIVGTSQWARADNGLPVPSVPWAYDNPDRIGTCAGISLFLDGLVDYPCNGKQEYFVCEIRITEENSGTESPVRVEGTARMPKAIPTPIILPEGYVAFPEDHAAYKIYKEYKLWEEARVRCISEGAQLAVTDTVDKIVHVADTLTNFTRENWLHVGIRRSNISKEWIRVDNGKSVAAIPWASFSTPDATSSGSCTAIPYGENGLANHNCDSGFYYFACEIKI